MSDSWILRGIAQLNISADDVGKARDWYASFLGVQPYFQRPDADHPMYVEFRLGDYQHELGIIDRRFLPPGNHGQACGVIARWHVDDVPATLQQLTKLGATEYEPFTEREGGFVTASAIDPFGNVLGLITSPHYLHVLATGQETANSSGNDSSQSE